MDSGVFYFLAGMILFFAVNCVLNSNPLYSAMSLAVTMVLLAFIFFLLKAYFLAGVQLIVYAGAVMVLFVMVLMLFDLKKEYIVFSKGRILGFLKILLAGMFCGYIARTVLERAPSVAPKPQVLEAATSIESLSKVLFMEYMFAFQLLGLLLLVIAIGAVAISRSKGGTHAKS